MNVAIINLKSFLKKIFKLVLKAMIILLLIRIIAFNMPLIENINLFNCCTNCFTCFFDTINCSNTKVENLKVISFFYPIICLNMEENETKNSFKIKNVNQTNSLSDSNNSKDLKINENISDDEKEFNEVIISDNSQTQIVNEKNIAENYNFEFNGVKINNQSIYKLTEENLSVENIHFNNKKILIYHTHTCESYTPSTKFNYNMTGNYRTIDCDYNVVRVGDELTKHLEEKGFEVIHNNTYHDYPSYNGSYDRSYETVQDILNKNPDIQIVIDIHRDAVGDGNTYGPTVKIDENKVAQMMFVIGTDGGGLEHPLWKQNLESAIKIQIKANELYPGLFRPIIVRNSRYNQHVAPYACIIEVGATGNTLEECLLSMQCLANIIDKSF